MPKETSAVLKDGWLHTDDLGRLDESGFLMLTGRKKNLLIFPNGENIVPEELEIKILSIPYVAECMAFLNESMLTMGAFAPDGDESTILDAIQKINMASSASHQIMKVLFREPPF